MVTIKRRQASIKRFHPVRLGVVTAAMLTIAGCGDGPQPNASPADTSDGTSTTTQSPPVEEQSQLVAMPDQTNALNIETPKFSTEVTVDRVVCYGSEGNLTALRPRRTTRLSRTSSLRTSISVRPNMVMVGTAASTTTRRTTRSPSRLVTIR